MHEENPNLMRARLIAVVVAVAAAGMPARAPAQIVIPGSRVIVSTTLNSTLQVFDTMTLRETQPPVPSKGGGPVRLSIIHLPSTIPLVTRPYLLAANHGVALGSLGIFDLAGPVITELPLSPFPARPGSVGVDAARVRVGTRDVPMAFVTNTTFALGGCGMPAGSVTAFDLSAVQTQGMAIESGTAELSGALPYAVAIDARGGRAYASSYCSDTLDTIEIAPVACAVEPVCGRAAIRRAGARPTGDGPDGVLFDDERGLLYTVNIAGHSMSVHTPDGGGIATTVPLAGAGPVEATLARSPFGRPWVITANGAGDGISVVDRDRIAMCVATDQPTCDAEVARIATVRGGAPEGVAYDALTSRAFVVNKNPFGRPSLSVVQLTEHFDGSVTGSEMGRIALGAISGDVPVPAFTVFDVVVLGPGIAFGR